MARPLRIKYPDACYHVMNRGNRRGAVFASRHDYELFLDKLGEVCETFGVRVRAYCLLVNHFHLYVQTPQPNLSRFMQVLLTGFTVKLNRKNQSSGHVFQGRYKAQLVEDAGYGQEVSRYVHLNPARVALAREANIEERRQLLRDYPWSSYNCLIGLREPPEWLDRPAVLNTWGGVTEPGMSAYRAYVEEGLLRDVRNPFEDTAEQSILGTEGFIEKIKRRYLLSRAADAREELALRRLQGSFDLLEVAGIVAEVYRVPLEELMARGPKHRTARRMLLYCVSRYCAGARSLTSLAQELGPLSVSGLTRARDRVKAVLSQPSDESRMLKRIEDRLSSTGGMNDSSQ